VSRLTAAQRELVRLAKAELAGFFGSLDLSRPEAVRDSLLEIVPLLVREYGDLASVAAAEWYEQVRPAGGFNARTVNGVTADQVAGSVRYQARSLFGDDPVQTLGLVQGAMQRFIAYSGRATVARNVALDPMKLRFARVPAGARTCAWCSLLASRGFVYATKKTAGLGEHWHDDCDCQIVASFDREHAHIDGYDPDRLYDLYQQARAASGSGDQKDIAAWMRRMFPDEFTDGVRPTAG